MKREGIEKLLDQELVKSIKKRPGMYLGGRDYKAIQNLLGYLFK